MSEEINSKPTIKEISLRSYIERNVSLFTVLGIFNALAIYSISIKDTETSEPLSFLFSLLSIVILWPLIIDTAHKNEDENPNYTLILFRFALVLAQFSLSLYTIKSFPGFFQILIFIIALIKLGLPFFDFLFYRYIKKKLSKFSLTNIKIIVALYGVVTLITSLILSYYISVGASELLKNVLSTSKENKIHNSKKITE